MNPNIAKLSLVLTTFTVVGLSTTSITNAASLYSITDLGSLGSENTAAYRVNDLGQVVGASRLPNQAEHAFFWDKSEGMLDLGTLNGTQSSAFGINNLGQVVGGTDTYQVFLWSKSEGMTAISEPTANYSIAYSINDLSQVVGQIGTPEGYTRAFLYNGGTLTDIGTLDGGFSSTAASINNSGQIVGYSSTSNGYRAFRTAPNTVITPTDNLGTLGGNFSAASDINDLGQVVGYSTTNLPNVDFRAFLIAPNSVITPSNDLGTLPGGEYFTIATGINNLGQVVGQSGSKAFLWENGIMTDLNSLISDDSNVNLIWANDINNKGQIVAAGFVNGQGRALLLTPTVPTSVPEPTSTLGILAVGALGIFIRKSVTVRRREDF
ncbi:MAG TPA: HAF repeat-containing protein [Cyanobacteria bacterium UBA8803]|nr:HAF repeat-containing protein [Cyanobacteria bacterium UBA9273]HBL59884.1 HAF repeat-containing protein [Cyanobacteria bacterium UBA8803]